MRKRIEGVVGVMVDNVSGQLGYMAVQDTAAQVELDDFIWFKPDEGIDYTTSLWELARLITGDRHWLIIQYDGFVLDGSRWNPKWLEYDYIGAPWPWYKDVHRIGNGGFSLRSAKLMKFLAHNPDRFPPRDPEDTFLCRIYRDALEMEGFRWAPEGIARDFAFERDRPRDTFGFHGIFNFPHVLSPERLEARIRCANGYVRSKREWSELNVG